MQHAVIMAGGIGSRLWPLSRAGRPKQMLPLAHGTPLLQAAWDRLDGAVPTERRWVCTGAEYAEGVHRILPDLAPARLLGEPSPRDTVNAIAFSAATMLAQDPDAVLAVLTADQVIEPADTFQKGLAAAYAAVEREPEALLTFAIEPTFPATGYGWVERREEVAPGVLRSIDLSKSPTSRPRRPCWPMAVLAGTVACLFFVQTLSSPPCGSTLAKESTNFSK